MTRRGRRLTLIGTCGAVLVAATTLVLTGLSGSITFFASPTDLATRAVQPGERLRLGGLVETGSVVHDGPAAISFKVTDKARDVTVTYAGLVPDLFREGQGVVAEGVLDAAGVFRADTLLARHDERYMPKEVADALKASGHWDDAARFGSQAQR